MDDNQKWWCKVEADGIRCTFHADSGKSLLSHYRTSHRNDKYFAVPCLFPGCPHHHPFKTEDNLRKHLSLHHPQFFFKTKYLGNDDAEPPLQQILVDQPDFQPTEGMSTSSHVTTPENAISYSSTTNKDSTDNIDPALYVLGLLAERKLTQVDLQCVLKWTTKFTNQSVCSILNKVLHTLVEDGCQAMCIESVTRVRNVFSDHLIPPDPFDGLKTEYMQRKYFRENYGLIEPITITLPWTSSDYVRRYTNEDLQNKAKSYCIVPLFPQLEALLNKIDVNQQVFGDKFTSKDNLSRFEDGYAFQQNPFFQAHPKGLQLHLYIDEVQMVDSLGSKTISGKMVFVYFTLGNLDSKYRTALKHINLLSIFPNEYVSIHGLNHLLQPIVDDIKKLEDGIYLTIFGEKVKVFGTLAVLIADNLASHAVGGFKCGFSSGFRKCRYCLGTDVEIQTFHSDGKFKPRSKKEHDQQCEGLDTTLSKHFGKLYGLNGRSVLNELKYFHVIGGLVPDIMHDLHEGVIGLILVNVLKYCTREKKYFSISDLNWAVQSFKYGHTEVKDKPSVISNLHLDNGKLRQSASQTALLANVLPLCVGSVIPEGDEVWSCFTTTLEILRMLTQNSISHSEILKLEFLIVEFLTSFKECFPDHKVTPKMHFLIHYPRHIRMMGPLNAFWCMRYEAKHSYFKKMSRCIGNFINLPFTLSYRHQYFQCFNLLSGGTTFLTSQIETPKTMRQIYVNKSLCSTQIRFLICNDEKLAKMRELPWVKLGSTTFKGSKLGGKKNNNKKKSLCTNSFVLCPLRGNINSDFGKILKIYQFQSNIFLVCQMYRSVLFDHHMQAFRIVKRKDNLHLVLHLQDLLDHRVFHSHFPVQIDKDTPHLGFEYIIPKCHSEHKFSCNAC